MLILNKSWVAIHVTSARRAFGLLYLDLARAVHPHDYALYDFEQWIELSQDGLKGNYIHTPRLRVRVPEVLLLHAFNGFVPHRVRFSRQSIFDRDTNVCQYCGRRFPRSQLTIDHVTPQSRGGADSWENLVLACLHCNVRKGNRTPEEAGMPLLRRPAKPPLMSRFGSRIPPDQLTIWQRFIDPQRWGVESTQL